MKRPGSRTAAFSLVEITIALGIAAFCLISIFGLLPVGITTNKTAADQTAANGILSAVISDLRATPRTIPRGGAATSLQCSIPIPGNPVASSPGDTTLYHTNEGKKCDLANQARYRTTVTFLPNGTAPRTATFVRLRVSWPAVSTLANATGAVETFCALDRN